MKDGWKRYKWAEVCAVCGHGGRRYHCSGCLYHGPVESPDVVLCLRVREGSLREARNGMGWIHRLRSDGRTPPPRSQPQYIEKPVVDPKLAELAREFEAALPDPSELAYDLGVSVESLKRLGVGYAADVGAFSFPMRDESNLVVGIRLRNRKAQKWAVKGSINGLFIPRRLPCAGPLFVVEGPTDTAAMLTLGLPCVGRPSNTAGLDYLVSYAKRFLPRREINVIVNNDPDGSDAERLTMIGFHSLASKLMDENAAASIGFGKPISVKDVREWVKAGATGNDITGMFYQESTVQFSCAS